MNLNDIQNISVLGSGIMGHGIAQCFIMGGYQVMLYDIQKSVLETAKAHIEKNLILFHQSGLLKKQDINVALQRLHTTMDMKQAVEKSDFIVEAVPEDLELKQELFQQVESLCSEDTILATNTSSLTLTEIGISVKDKSRLIVTHWFNPPHIVPTVEVVKGEFTSDETMQITYQLLEKIKKMPVKLNFELPGFLINRIQIAMVRELFDLYEKGVASAEDIDKAVKGSIGFRLANIGPLRTVDFGGIEIWLKFCKNLLPLIQSSTDPPETLQRLVSQGHLGIKSGKGFYDYTMDSSKTDLDGAVQKRDHDFLNLLKNHYCQSI